VGGCVWIIVRRIDCLAVIVQSLVLCQVQLYEDFAKSRAKKSVVDSLQEEQPSGASSVHVFQVYIPFLRSDSAIVVCVLINLLVMYVLE